MHSFLLAKYVEVQDLQDQIDDFLAGLFQLLIQSVGEIDRADAEIFGQGRQGESLQAFLVGERSGGLEH